MRPVKRDSWLSGGETIASINKLNLAICRRLGASSQKCDSMPLHFFTRILMVTQLYMLQHVHTGLRQSLSCWMLALTLHCITMIFSHPSLRRQEEDSMRKGFFLRCFMVSLSIRLSQRIHHSITKLTQHKVGIIYFWSSSKSSYGNLLSVQLSTNLLYKKCTSHFILSRHSLHALMRILTHFEQSPDVQHSLITQVSHASRTLLHNIISGFSEHGPYSLLTSPVRCQVVNWWNNSVVRNTTTESHWSELMLAEFS